jgi:hypothetical protein
MAYGRDFFEGLRIGDIRAGAWAYFGLSETTPANTLQKLVYKSYKL